MHKLLTFDELREHGVLYTRQHLARLERDGHFPKRVAIGANRVGWVESEIDAFVKKAMDRREVAK